MGFLDAFTSAFVPSGATAQGMFEGFRGRADAAYQQNLRDDAQRRTSETELYKYLLNSRDPEIRALAMTGIYEAAQPGRRKGGFGGLMGELTSSSVYPQIRALSDQLVPDFSHARPLSSSAPNKAPAVAGSAALPEDSPVEPGSAPMPPGLGVPGPRIPEETIQARDIPGEIPQGSGVGGGPVTNVPSGPEPPSAPAAAQAQAPAPPPEEPQVGRFKRRGTQVPTAEEIAEYQARIPTETRIGLAKQYLGEDDAKRAILGILGAPQTTKQFSAPTFAVLDPINNEPVPVAFDYTSGAFFFTDGTRVPRGAKFVQMSRSSSSGGLNSYIEDTPEQRAQLQAAYPTIQLPPGQSPTGYLRLQVRPDGTAMAIPSEFTPPPAYSGTTEILDPQGVPVRAPINRGGGTGPALGDVDQPGQSEAQTKAAGLLAAVDKQITAAAVGPGGLRRQVSPAQMDQITKQESVRAGLPYQTYTELQQAVKARPETTARERREDPNAGLSLADRVRQRALQNRGAPVAPPQAPSARSRGAGPGPRR